MAANWSRFHWEPLFSARCQRLVFRWRDAVTRDFLLKMVVAFGLTGVGGVILEKKQFKLPEHLTPVAWALLAGGTRIGPSLYTFNQKWSRRLLGQNAVVLLISDGLDRDNPAELSAQMERLQNVSAMRGDLQTFLVDPASPYFGHLRLRERIAGRGEVERDVLIGRATFVDGAAPSGS